MILNVNNFSVLCASVCGNTHIPHTHHKHAPHTHTRVRPYAYVAVPVQVSSVLLGVNFMDNHTCERALWQLMTLLLPRPSISWIKEMASGEQGNFLEKSGEFSKTLKSRRWLGSFSWNPTEFYLTTHTTHPYHAPHTNPYHAPHQQLQQVPWIFSKNLHRIEILCHLGIGDTVDKEGHLHQTTTTTTIIIISS